MFVWIAKRTGVQLPSPPFLIQFPSAGSAKFPGQRFCRFQICVLGNHGDIHRLGAITDKGIHAAKETTQRVADWAAKVQSKGVTIKQMYWTLGHYDQVCIFEAPNDETAASVLLSADILGNIRTQTLRAFTSAEMEKILANIP